MHKMATNSPLGQGEWGGPRHGAVQHCTVQYNLECHVTSNITNGVRDDPGNLGCGDPSWSDVRDAVILGASERASE